MNYNKFFEYLQNNKTPFCKAEVESNPFGNGGKQELWFYVTDLNELSSDIKGQGDINDWIYAWTDAWQQYKGNFKIIK